MRKSLALKTLLRSPLKTLLTFLLLAAASFALFSHVADYIITAREAARIKDSCYGVAALDNTVQNIAVWKQFSSFIAYAKEYEVEDSPWPSNEQLEEFSSLPGATLADTRYMTAGLVEDYERLYNKDVNIARCVIEGNYAGYEENEINSGSGTYTGDSIWLLFDDVTVLASERELEAQVRVKVDLVDTNVENNPREFYEGIKKGTRCLVIAGGSNELMMYGGKEFFCVVEGLGEDYLGTDEFSFFKEMTNAVNQSVYTYDLVYTSDTRAIPSFNGGGMEIASGRGLTAEDRDACIVNEFFLETYGLSIGDRVSIQLGNVLFHQGGWNGAKAGWNGTKAGVRQNVSDFVDTAELEIVGTYRILDDVATRVAASEWMYTESTVFVPATLLPIKVPVEYETAKGEYSVLIENAGDIRAFWERAQLSAEEMGVGLIFSDGGWLEIEDSFEAAQAASLITTVLYIIGVGLALILAVYLYIGRNRQEYAIMRALGVPRKEAEITVILPFTVLSVAMPIGGIAGLFQATKAVAGALGELTGSLSDRYVPDVALPVWVVFLCFFLELAFTMLIALVFLRRIKKIPPMELLAGRQGMGRRKYKVYKGIEIYNKEKALLSNSTCVLSNSKGFEVTKLSNAGEMSLGGNYRALCHVAAYILRHMRRRIGKTAVSLLLAIVLLSGAGMFVLAKSTYSEAFDAVAVRGKVLQFSSESIRELSNSDMLDDFYYYGSFIVYANGLEQSVPMTFTNNLEHYLAGDYEVSYADGYDISVLNGTGAVCLVGKNMAKRLDISLGDKISLLSYVLYSAMESEDWGEKELQEAALEQTQPYTVAGIIESDSASAEGIFASANYAAEELYGRPFLIEYGEFQLSDNRRLDELEVLLAKKQKVDLAQYSPRASYSINSGKLEDMKRLCNILESIFPIVVAAAVMIGILGSVLVILQSAKEAAFLRVLGVTKKRARCMLILEQAALCLVGVILVAGGLALYSPGVFARSMGTLAVCYALYFLGCVCGAVAAAVQITRHRIMELLQVKE